MKDTLIIMGNHPRTRGEFDFNRTDCDVWIFNEAAKQPWIKRYDAVMQLHIPTIWRNPKNRNDPKHYEWLKTTSIPVYMQEKYEDVPASVKFPKDEILAMLPNAIANGKPIREVACSPAWALAAGIYMGYKRIEIYGVELESNTEYAYQQGNWKYWVGVAAGRGIEVDMHSAMFDAPLYGYEGEVFIEYKEIADRIGEVSQKLDDVRRRFTAESVQMWKMFEDILFEDNGKDLIPQVQKTITAVVDLGEVEGVVQENKRYLEKADTMKKHAGEFVFSRQEFEQGAAALQHQMQSFVEQSAVVKGQLDMVHNTVIRMAKGSPKRRKSMGDYRVLLQTFIQYSNLMGQVKGATAENFGYMARLDRGIKAMGGIKSEAAILDSVKIE